jgi:hypothetical protein
MREKYIYSYIYTDIMGRWVDIHMYTGTVVVAAVKEDECACLAGFVCRLQYILDI